MTTRLKVWYIKRKELANVLGVEANDLNAKHAYKTQAYVVVKIWKVELRPGVFRISGIGGPRSPK